MKIVYEDNNVLVVIKPAGVDSEAKAGYQDDMVSLIKKHLSLNKEDLYVGIIHRLDKPVSGMMVFAKNKSTAGYLSKEFANHNITKKYIAVVCGKPEENSGNFTDYIIKDKKVSKAVIVDKNNKDGKKAALNYRVLDTKAVGDKIYSLVEIELLTGRFHQIRIQFASRGLALLGDRKYGDFDKELINLEKWSSARDINIYKMNIALACVSLKFKLQNKKELEFYEEPDEEWYRLWKML